MRVFEGSEDFEAAKVQRAVRAAALRVKAGRAGLAPSVIDIRTSTV